MRQSKNKKILVFFGIGIATCFTLAQNPPAPPAPGPHLGPHPPATVIVPVPVPITPQGPPPPPPPPLTHPHEKPHKGLTELGLTKEEEKRTEEVEKEGLEVRIKDITRFRGVRSNPLHGYGLVVGLNGTGDTQQNTPVTAYLIANALKEFGTTISGALLNIKNTALVSISASLPPFASPGNNTDITVQSIGDATSLEGGYLMRAPLYAANNREHAVVVAQGAVSTGGFNISSKGSSVQKNLTNVGIIANGGIIERTVATQIVFQENKIYLELLDHDITTAQRIASAVSSSLRYYSAKPIDGGTVEVTFPIQVDPIDAMSKIEAVTVKADVAAVVVINERTGTIVIGANVKLGPAVIAQGGLQIRIQQTPLVSQPNAFGGGRTVVTQQTQIKVKEQTAEVGLIPPNATLADLAKIFQALKLTPRDIISILQALKEQGSLKARLKVQ